MTRVVVPYLLFGALMLIGTVLVTPCGCTTACTPSASSGSVPPLAIPRGLE